MEEEKQGCRSGFPGSEVQDSPSELPNPRLAKRRVPSGHSRHHGNVSPPESKGRRQAPQPRMGPLQKLPRSRSCPRGHAGEQAPHKTLRPNSICSGWGLGRGAVTWKGPSSPAPRSGDGWPGSLSEQADGQGPLLRPRADRSPCRPPRWFLNRAVCSADTQERDEGRHPHPRPGSATPLPRHHQSRRTHPPTSGTNPGSSTFHPPRSKASFPQCLKESVP